jgi:hypothetical protein
LTSQRCTRRSLPNYLVMTSYHWNVRQNILTWRWWMNDKITWRHARIVPTLFLRLFHWMSINLGQFVFFIVFQLFVSWTFFFSNTRYWFEIYQKNFFFEYRKYFIRQRWLPVTEGHLTPTSPEAFPHNASLYVIINYPDRWRYYLVTW